MREKMKERLASFLNKYKKIHIIGISSQEGRAVFDYLINHKEYDIVGHESSSRESFLDNFMKFSDAYTREDALRMADRFLSSGVIINFGDDYLKNIGEEDLVIATQAWRRYEKNAPLFEYKRSKRLIQAIEIVFMILDCKIIGVTGTAGKSTVTAFIESIIKEANKPLYFSGNDRENKWDLSLAESLDHNGLALFEISHRHLMDLTYSPHIAVITNIYPHHLDDAGDFTKYQEIKKNIFSYQNENDILIADYSLIKNNVIKREDVAGALLSFGKEEEADAYLRANSLFVKNQKLIEADDLMLKGDHNLLNAGAAVLVGKALGFSDEVIKQGLIKTQSLRYRMEIVGKNSNLTFINDGKSSDPLATIEAVVAVPNILALILGGVREGSVKGDFSALGKKIALLDIKHILVYGRSKNIIIEDLVDSGVALEKLILSDSLKSAFMILSQSIRDEDKGVILFSPSCQSFDEFRDYRERAESFNAFVKDYLSLKT